MWPSGGTPIVLAFVRRIEAPNWEDEDEDEKKY